MMPGHQVAWWSASVPGEEQRAQAQADAAQDGLAGGRLKARALQRGDDERDRDRQQEPWALEEGEVGAVEVDAEVVGGERPDEQRGQEGRTPWQPTRPCPAGCRAGASRSDSFRRA